MELKQFLVKAKMKAYASGGEGKETILVDGGREMTFEENGFRYRDRYFGFNPFIGEEVVWQGNQLVWAMNYYGKVFNPLVREKAVYQFLQKALTQLKEERPYRGAPYFKEQDFEYKNANQGTLESFMGLEKIFYKGEEVYRLDYHGGVIKSAT
jgi:hypothetical protein